MPRLSTFCRCHWDIWEVAERSGCPDQCGGAGAGLPASLGPLLTEAICHRSGCSIVTDGAHRPGWVDDRPGPNRGRTATQSMTRSGTDRHGPRSHKPALVPGGKSPQHKTTVADSPQSPHGRSASRSNKGLIIPSAGCCLPHTLPVPAPSTEGRTPSSGAPRCGEALAGAAREGIGAVDRCRSC